MAASEPPDSRRVTAAAGSTSPPALIAYDGTDLAAFAIQQAAERLPSGLDVIVVCPWRPVDVCFTPVGGRRLRATAAIDVRRAAEETAAHGAELAEVAGFKARSRTIQAAPTWKGLIEVAEQQECGLIVIGSHKGDGLLGRIGDPVASATVSHFKHSVLVIENRRPRPPLSLGAVFRHFR